MLLPGWRVVNYLLDLRKAGAAKTEPAAPGFFTDEQDFGLPGLDRRPFAEAARPKLPFDVRTASLPLAGSVTKKTRAVANPELQLWLVPSPLAIGAGQHDQSFASEFSRKCFAPCGRFRSSRTSLNIAP